MKQIVITKAGGPEVLKIREVKDPLPGNGELIIRVKAVGINFADIMARKGMYMDAPKIPCVVGYEVSGIVESIGKNVDENLIGKPVITMTRFGGYSDLVKARSSDVFEKPININFNQAAALPVNYLTAYQLLVVMGGLHNDETILIHNAGGGVGLAALDITKHIGATAIGTASFTKHVFLLKHGFDHVIDYRTQNWLKDVKSFTNGKGVELVIDPIGGRNIKKSYKALRSTGRLGLFGISTISKPGISGKLHLLKLVFQTPKFHPFSLMNLNKGVFGVNAGHLWGERKKVRGWMDKILNGVRDGWIQPHVGRSFKFEEVGEAHSYIEERKNIGKVVLVL